MIINGNLNLSESTIESLGQLKEVNGNVYLEGCIKLKSLENLKKVTGNLIVNYSYYLETLGNLETVDGHLDLRVCRNLKSLGKLKEIGGRIFLSGRNLSENYIHKNYRKLLFKCNWKYTDSAENFKI